MDANSYEGRVNTGNYTRILIPHYDESWKNPIKTELYMAIGLVSGSLFLQTVAVIIHSVTKQKLFVVILSLFATGIGTAGGYFDMNATGDYKNGLSDAISSNVKPFYNSKKEKMLIGYNLAKFGAVLMILGSVFILLYISLYIPFGDGKWIWQKKTEVLPTTDKARSGKLSDAVIRRIQQNIYKEKPLESVRTKVKIITVQEFNKS
ncbi:Hypothetical predicted protein [Mytilus galloprovincialis]|uniref:Uncharacterized protein n=1 Tax=Mytilus galloprovincialis TaxID=29158 RepID=A0A8B6D075_MYTGA|nr:Hypothetical predicted protein [Mytilus galloprovincialis]